VTNKQWQTRLACFVCRCVGERGKLICGMCISIVLGHVTFMAGVYATDNLVRLAYRYHSSGYFWLAINIEAANAAPVTKMMGKPCQLPCLISSYLIITLPASSGKRNVTVWRLYVSPFVCLSRRHTHRDSSAYGCCRTYLERSASASFPPVFPDYHCKVSVSETLIISDTLSQCGVIHRTLLSNHTVVLPLPFSCRCALSYCPKCP